MAMLGADWFAAMSQGTGVPVVVLGFIMGALLILLIWGVVIYSLTLMKVQNISGLVHAFAFGVGLVTVTAFEWWPSWAFLGLVVLGLVALVFLRGRVFY